MGTKYAVEHFLNLYNWDYQTRACKISPVSGQVTVCEFDYKAVSGFVYDKNGIVRSHYSTVSRPGVLETQLLIVPP